MKSNTKKYKYAPNIPTLILNAKKLDWHIVVTNPGAVHKKDQEFEPLLTKPILNIAKCLSCGHRGNSNNFPVEIESELQGQIHCPKCGSENIEI